MSKGIEGGGFVSTPVAGDILSTQDNISGDFIAFLAKKKVFTPMTEIMKLNIGEPRISLESFVLGYFLRNITRRTG